MEGSLKGGQRLHGALSVHPIAIFGIDVWRFGGNRRYFPALSSLPRRFDLRIPQLGMMSIVKALGVLQDERVQIDQCANPIRNAIGHAADHAAPLGMATQHHIREFLPADEVRHIGDVCLKVHLRRQ
jgi:hypothetical protein